jgi:hypothetical protein
LKDIPAEEDSLFIKSSFIKSIESYLLSPGESYPSIEERILEETNIQNPSHHEKTIVT